MDLLIDYAKAEKLAAMYRSVDRMNRTIAFGNPRGDESSPVVATQKQVSGFVTMEQHIQRKLRREFEELLDSK